MLSLEYFAPAPPLRDLVSTYYLLRCRAPRISDLLSAELPQLRFVLTGGGTMNFGNGDLPFPRAAMTGPTLRSARFDAYGPLTVFGMGVLPAGWAALFGLSADELADDLADLCDVVGPIAGHAWERLANAPDGAAMAQVADAMLLLLCGRAKAPPLWFTRAADAWLTSSRDPHVDDLVHATGMSARQVERMARRVYGAPPKMLARKYRTLQAAAQLARHPELGWEVAAGDAFYDQPHFIREFKQFVGVTPTQFTAGRTTGKLALEKRERATDAPISRLS